MRRKVRHDGIHSTVYFSLLCWTRPWQDCATHATVADIARQRRRRSTNKRCRRCFANVADHDLSFRSKKSTRAWGRIWQLNLPTANCNKLALAYDVSRVQYNVDNMQRFRGLRRSSASHDYSSTGCWSDAGCLPEKRNACRSLPKLFGSHNVVCRRITPVAGTAGSPELTEGFSYSKSKNQQGLLCWLHRCVRSVAASRRTQHFDVHDVVFTVGC